MNLDKNTVLFTGGSTGIDFELAKAFLERVICGRRILQRKTEIGFSHA